LHFEPVGVSVERLVVIEVVDVEIDDYFVAAVHYVWKTVEVHIDLEHWEIGVNRDINGCPIASLILFVQRRKVEDHLLIFGLRMKTSPLQLSIWKGFLLSILRAEDVWA